MRILREIIDRLRAETPAFFAEVRNLCATLCALCAAYAEFMANMPPDSTPDVLFQIGRVLSVAFAVAAFVCQLVTKNEQ